MTTPYTRGARPLAPRTSLLAELRKKQRAHKAQEKALAAEANKKLKK